MSSRFAPARYGSSKSQVTPEQLFFITVGALWAVMWIPALVIWATARSDERTECGPLLDSLLVQWILLVLPAGWLIVRWCWVGAARRHFCGSSPEEAGEFS